MSSAAVTQKPAKNQQVAASRPQEAAVQREEKEASASGSASVSGFRFSTSRLEYITQISRPMICSSFNAGEVIVGVANITLPTPLLNISPAK